MSKLSWSPQGKDSYDQIVLNMLLYSKEFYSLRLHIFTELIV